GERVVKPAMVAVAPPPFAEIGEVKPALPVEHDIIRRRQFVTAALAVENTRLAGARIDPLDGAALVILRRPSREKPALRVLVAAVVAVIRAPSGPRATPFGPPPGVPIGDLVPSGAMRVTELPAISPK